MATGRAVRVAAWLFAGGAALVATSALAQTWKFESSVALQETITNNVNLSPPELRQSDLVTQITPALRFSEKGARTRLDGYVSVPVLLYLRTGSENNNVYPSVYLSGDAKLVDDFFHVEGLVSIAQQYFNPFGAQPADLTSATQNRYQSATYAANPYLKGVLAGSVNYELRMNNIWTNLSGAPINTNDSYTMEWLGKLSDTERRLGWRANFDISSTRFNNQTPLKSQLYRFEPVYNYDRQLQLTASAGYEENDYTLTSSSGPIYGVGFDWRPTPITHVKGFWEHRFFGSSYLFSFDHRTPLSSSNILFSRNITTYPQQLFTLPTGVPLSQVLNNVYLSTIPDAAERQRVVDQFLRNRGLPASLGTPVTVYSQQILLQQTASLTAGLIGARNTLFLTLYSVRTEQITAAGDVLPPILAQQSDNTQIGGNLVWTHNFTPSVIMTTNLTASRTKALPPLDYTTNQGAVNVQVSSPLSALTSAFVGARYQMLNTTVGSEYKEVAAFVGLTHIFK
jgi:uncharacterized protein (PEP-CTERM system associated)